MSSTSAARGPTVDFNDYAKPENYGGTKESMTLFVQAHRKQRDLNRVSIEALTTTTTTTTTSTTTVQQRAVKPLSANHTSRLSNASLIALENRPKTGSKYGRFSLGKCANIQATQPEASNSVKVRRVTIGGSGPSSGSTGISVVSNLIFQPFDSVTSKTGVHPGSRLKEGWKSSVPQSLGDVSEETGDVPGGQQPRSRSSSFVSQASVSAFNRERRRSSIAPLSRIRKHIIAKVRFRKIVRLVIIGIRLCALAEKIRRTTSELSLEEHKTFTDIASEAIVTDDGFNFDLSHYKAKREINISNEVRYILSIPSAVRTPEQVQTAVYGMQHLESFAEYPLHLQEKLCKVGWFTQVSEKRVIIRQGHLAENFYFILSGQAVVRFLEQNPITGESQMRTAAVLKRGSSFGELALLHHSRRTATVVSQSAIQLLTISRDDFFEIIMGQSLTGEVPDHIKYLSTLDFMKDWPIEKLLEKPDDCVFIYFKRGTVIVKDINKSDWLYVIKTGSCRVLKQLNAVVPRTQAQRRRQELKRLSDLKPSLAASLEFELINLKVSTGSHRRPASALSSKTSFSVEQVDIDRTSLPRRRPSTAKHRPSGLKPNQKKEAVFVQIEHLQPRDVFGLRGINFELDCLTDSQKTTSVCLVSNGAECIMLSKKCFLEHANHTVQQQIRRQTAAYPAEDVLQENLQVNADWLEYKRQLTRFYSNNRS